MDIDGVIRLIRDLNFPRFSGSEGERRAQELVTARLAESGIVAERRPFDAPWIEVAHASVEVGGQSRPIKPIEELMQQEAEWWPPPQLDVEGVLAPATEPQRGIILAHTEPDTEAVRQPGPVAQLFLFNETSWVHPYVVSISEHVPPAYVRRDDRDWLLQRIGQTARIRWETRATARPFANLVAEIPGDSDEAVLLGAHLDSFPGTPGSSDDAFGCALLVELALHFTVQPLSRTLRLYWFTGEEIDRCGSRVAARRELSREPRARLLINVDGGVSEVHGEPTVVSVTGGEDMVEWAQTVLGGLAGPVELLHREIEACDAESFWRVGFPTVFPHSTRSVTGGYPHLPTDNPDTVDPESVARLGQVALELAEEAVHRPPSAPDTAR